MRTRITTAEGSFGSRNYVSLSLFTVLRRMVSGPDALLGGQKVLSDNPDNILQEALLSVFVAVNTVEVFVNIYFKTYCEKNQRSSELATVVQDLNTRKGLAYKIDKWPKLCFGKTLDPNDPRFGQFTTLRNMRNGLMHFQASTDVFQHPDGTISPEFSSLGSFQNLGQDTPRFCMSAVVGFIEQLLETEGLNDESVSKVSKYWIGFG